MTETKICQNCKQNFNIEQADFDFYKRIEVPPPTMCPLCRFTRRLAFRNERSLYRRACDLCQKKVISVYSLVAPFPVYCHDCWYSDKWNALDYGQEYDFSVPFFTQLQVLFNKVPHLALWQRNVINCEFANMTGESKNVYLSVSVVQGSENVFYSKSIDASFNIVDSYNLKNSDSCYENIDGDRNYNSHYLTLSRNCIDSRFLYDCANCKNCLLSSNLRNKEFVIRNKQYSKDEYFKELAKIDFGSRKVRDALVREFADISREALHKFANNIKCVNSDGNNLTNAKNSHACFDYAEIENLSYCYRGFRIKDSMDFDYGGDSELMYEYTTGALNDYNVKFSYSAWDMVRNAEYTDSCKSASDLFGAFGIVSKENVIFNKVYLKEAYKDLRAKIIAHMNEMPYQGKNGRVYRYGEFFPIETSPFSYNETPAQDFFPLIEQEIKERGYRWRAPEAKLHTASMPAGTIPDHIKDAPADILQKTLGCAHNGSCPDQCSVAFRLTPDELEFYKKNSIPLPDLCPNCRFYERLKNVLPPRSWHRKCMNKGCQNEFETSYAPDRPEIVYCEICYNAEVV